MSRSLVVTMAKLGEDLQAIIVLDKKTKSYYPVNKCFV